MFKMVTVTQKDIYSVHDKVCACSIVARMATSSKIHITKQVLIIITSFINITECIAPNDQ